MRPLVSFVIPVKNDADNLRRCLSSITDNAYPRELIEILVVDNESHDGSGHAAREHGAFVITAADKNVAALRNRGARASLGNIVAFVDADHTIAANWVGSAVSILEDTEVAAVGAPYHTDPQANWVQRRYDGLRVRRDHQEEVAWLGSGNLAVKRGPFERIGGFNTSLTACEDVDLCNRLRLSGHRIVSDPALRSVHFGDPRTLKALFLGELWRGRDNLKVSLSGPRTFRNLRSAMIPVAHLAMFAIAIIGLVAGRPWLALISFALTLLPVVMKAAIMMRRQHDSGAPGLADAGRSAFESFAVAMVFDTARALALLLRGSHRARRAS